MNAFRRLVLNAEKETIEVNDIISHELIAMNTNVMRAFNYLYTLYIGIKPEKDIFSHFKRSRVAGVKVLAVLHSRITYQKEIDLLNKKQTGEKNKEM